MNIEKLAKHLKEFTLDEINMIAECDCKIELEHLLNSNKIYFEQGLYKYKEKEVLKLVSQGFSNKEIADKMFVREVTVKTHLNSIFKKLKVANRTQAVLVSGYLQNNN